MISIISLIWFSTISVFGETNLEFPSKNPVLQHLYSTNVPSNHNLGSSGNSRVLRYPSGNPALDYLNDDIQGYPTSNFGLGQSPVSSNANYPIVNPNVGYSSNPSLGYSNKKLTSGYTTASVPSGYPSGRPGFGYPSSNLAMVYSDNSKLNYPTSNHAFDYPFDNTALSNQTDIPALSYPTSYSTPEYSSNPILSYPSDSSKLSYPISNSAQGYHTNYPGLIYPTGNPIQGYPTDYTTLSYPTSNSVSGYQTSNSPTPYTAGNFYLNYPSSRFIPSKPQRRPILNNPTGIPASGYQTSNSPTRYTADNFYLNYPSGHLIPSKPQRRPILSNPTGNPALDYPKYPTDDSTVNKRPVTPYNPIRIRILYGSLLKDFDDASNEVKRHIAEAPRDYGSRTDQPFVQYAMIFHALDLLMDGLLENIPYDAMYKPIVRQAVENISTNPQATVESFKANLKKINNQISELRDFIKHQQTVCKEKDSEECNLIIQKAVENSRSPILTKQAKLLEGLSDKLKLFTQDYAAEFENVANSNDAYKYLINSSSHLKPFVEAGEREEAKKMSLGLGKPRDSVDSTL